MLVLSAFLKLFLFYVSGCFACCMPGLHACACAGQKRTSYSPESGSWVIVSHHVVVATEHESLKKQPALLSPESSLQSLILFSIWMCQLFLPSVAFFLQLGWVYWKCFTVFLLIHYTSHFQHFIPTQSPFPCWIGLPCCWHSTGHHWCCHSLCLVFPLCCQCCSPALSCPHLFVFVSILF